MHPEAAERLKARSHHDAASSDNLHWFIFRPLPARLPCFVFSYSCMRAVIPTSIGTGVWILDLTCYSAPPSFSMLPFGFARPNDTMIS